MLTTELVCADCWPDVVATLVEVTVLVSTVDKRVLVDKSWPGSLSASRLQWTWVKDWLNSVEHVVNSGQQAPGLPDI